MAGTHSVPWLHVKAASSKKREKKKGKKSELSKFTRLIVVEEKVAFKTT
jgi:hypothetical protein